MNRILVNNGTRYWVKDLGQFVGHEGSGGTAPNDGFFTPIAVGW